MRFAERRLRACGRRGAAEDETGIAGSLRQRDERLADVRRDRHVLDVRHRARLRQPSHLFEHARPRDRDHHDAGRPPLSLRPGHLPAQRVPQDQLFQRHARPEPQGARAKPPDRPRRHLDQPGSGLVDAQLRMNRPVPQAERQGAVRGDLRDPLLHLSAEPRRSHIDRLLKVGPFERVRLVEQGEDCQLTLSQQAFERDLAPRDEILDQDLPGRLSPLRRDLRVVEEPLDAPPGRGEILGPVRADDAAARREKCRFQDAGEPNLLRGLPRIRVPVEDAVPRRRHRRLRQQSPHRRLVPRRNRRVHRVVRQPERRRDDGGRHRRVLVHPHDSVHRIRPRKLRGSPRALLRVAKIESQEPSRVHAFERARFFRRDGDIQVKLSCRRQEVRRLVGCRRQKEQHAGHAPILR